MQHPLPPASQQPFLLNRIQKYAVIAVVFSYVLDAPLRFALTKIHASSAMYARDLASVAIIFTALIHWVMGKKQDTSTVVAFILMAHLFLGVITLGSIPQPFVAFKLFLPLLLGIASYETIQRTEQRLHFWAAIAFSLTCIGVLINWFTEMPWSGETFDSAVGQVNVSVEWTTAGVHRLSGFARASYDAATITALTAIPLLVRVETRVWQKIVINAVAILVILLTTTKGAILAIGVITLYAATQRRDRSRRSLNLILMLAPAAGLAIPALLYLYGGRLEVDNNFWIVFSSFAERINTTWPAAFDLLKLNGNLLYGRGLGGIGFPQMFGDASHYNPADSAMVYLFITFGVLSLVYIYATLLALKNSASSTPTYIWRCTIGWLIYWCVYGLTTNTIENPFLMFLLGLIIGAAFRQPGTIGIAPAALSGANQSNRAKA